MRILKQAKLLLAMFIILVLLIPTGFYLFSKRSESGFSSKQKKLDIKIPPKDKTVEEELETLKRATQSSSSAKTTSVNIPALGPTLNFTVAIEGRPKDKQAAKVFVGISAGKPAPNPKYLISFTVDLPDIGIYKGISLAGLDLGSTYTAYIKGPSQIASASAFVLSSNEVYLNASQPITLLSGDLNEDNAINSADYSIFKSAYGARPTAKNWSERADFNMDGVVNSADLSIILKNFGKTGTSGIWYSPIPISSKSGGLKMPAEATASGGYYLWIPNL